MIDANILTEKLKYTTHDSSTFQLEPGAVVNASAYRALKGNVSMPLTNLRGVDRTPKHFATHNPSSWAKYFLEPIMLRAMETAPTGWDSDEELWRTTFFPRDEPIMVLTPNGMPTPQALVLGPCQSRGIAVWPMREVDQSGTDKRMYVPLCDGASRVYWIFAFQQPWELVQCHWSAPAEQWCELHVGRHFLGRGASLRLVQDKPAEAMLTVAARNCYWPATVTEQDVRRLALREQVDARPSVPFAKVLEMLINIHSPGLTDVELYDIILARAPRQDDVLETLFEAQDMKEFIDDHDPERFETDKKRYSKQKSNSKQFLQGCAGIRERLRPHFEELELLQASEHRTLGPAGMADAAWTYDVVRAWLPAGVSLYRDSTYKRWRAIWPLGDCSRAWDLYGYKQSALLMLRTVWKSYEELTGIACAIPGIVAAVDEAAAALARGRGRGRRGGRRGRGRGRAVPPEPPIPAPEEAEDAGPPPAPAPVAAVDPAAVGGEASSNASNCSSQPASPSGSSSSSSDSS